MLSQSTRSPRSMRRIFSTLLRLGVMHIGDQLVYCLPSTILSAQGLRPAALDYMAHEERSSPWRKREKSPWAR